VLLLPHGFEGQGPEHSSARIERFLQLCAADNIQVVVPSTPAQYFHLLRRQMHRDIRKPLVVFTPKSLLRLPAARSRTDDFIRGYFREMLDDPRDVDRSKVRGVILCSGKVYYELAEKREKEGLAHVALVRVEQLYSFPGKQILELVGGYANATEVRWVQEEPENMGAYRFVRERLTKDVARDESGSPASGSFTVHERHQQALLQAAFEGL
jgi:2-oxoglutarate dehydrogenase E1 component